MMWQLMDWYVLHSWRCMAAGTPPTQVVLLQPLRKPGQVTITTEGI